MELISFAIFGVLLLVSLVHIGWAFGMAWPAKTREMLVTMVTGMPKGTPMPPAALTMAVAVVVFGFGLVALWGGGVIVLPMFAGLKGWALLGVAAIFGLRGLATYLPFGPLQAAVQPFRTLDLRYFAPLCGLLSAGYFAIFWSL